MIRKIFLQIFISIMIIIILTSTFIFIIIQINKSRPEKKDKFYELRSTTNNNLMQTITYHLMKPIFESIFDYCIEKYGLKEYLKKTIHQEKEENSINFYEITEGSGIKSMCGQIVSLQIYKISGNLLTSFLSQNQVTSNITLKIGQDDLKELSLGIIGMKEGGERIIIVKITNNNKITYNSYYIKLIEIKDKYPDSVNNMIIFDDLVNKIGKQVKCGDEISIKYSIIDHNGRYVIKNQTIQLKVGSKMMPLAIELGVIGMRIGDSRTIISPPELLNVNNEMLIPSIDTDKKDAFIIKLSLSLKT
ncbi:MAG: FKBP-type peptidyl-prolyl cis-trans isomerase [Wolbachia endosymbiont of Menacanthus eurysternus]|nr:MAG: FKBP-type peptidyl-prolyl cis-trans isomerase [Wolbachia endosymbiont of Menacanthus eurysternus]